MVTSLVREPVPEVEELRFGGLTFFCGKLEGSVQGGAAQFVMLASPVPKASFKRSEDSRVFIHPCIQRDEGVCIFVVDLRICVVWVAPFDS